MPSEEIQNCLLLLTLTFKFIKYAINCVSYIIKIFKMEKCLRRSITFYLVLVSKENERYIFVCLISVDYEGQADNCFS